jgi:hypothetical protein
MGVAAYGTSPPIGLVDVNGVPYSSTNPVPVKLYGNGKVVPTLGNNLFYDDMNVTNGGVARGSTIGSSFTDVYNKTHANGGVVIGFTINLENMSDPVGQAWFIRLIVDGVDLFNGSTGLSIGEMLDPTIYEFTTDPTKNAEWIGFSFKDKSVRWEGPMDLPITYASNITIKLRKQSSSKTFFAGLVNLTRE